MPTHLGTPLSTSHPCSGTFKGEARWGQLAAAPPPQPTPRCLKDLIREEGASLTGPWVDAAL